jgi:hypothetical protein
MFSSVIDLASIVIETAWTRVFPGLQITFISDHRIRVKTVIDWQEWIYELFVTFSIHHPFLC